MRSIDLLAVPRRWGAVPIDKGHYLFSFCRSIISYPHTNVKSFLALFAFLLKKVLFLTLGGPYILMEILHTLPCSILSLESALQGRFLKISLVFEGIEYPFFHHEVLEA